VNFKVILNNILSKLNFLDSENRISLTNMTVAVFVLITAIRALFGGSTLNISTFAWKIQQIDLSATMPMLFSLLNYSHKRHVINKSNQPTTINEKEN
jgi:hypothetical protein